MSTSYETWLNEVSKRQCDECKVHMTFLDTRRMCAALGCDLFLCKPCWRAHAVQHLLEGNGDLDSVMVRTYYDDVGWGE